MLHSNPATKHVTAPVRWDGRWTNQAQTATGGRPAILIPTMMLENRAMRFPRVCLAPIISSLSPKVFHDIETLSEKKTRMITKWEKKSPRKPCRYFTHSSLNYWVNTCEWVNKEFCAHTYANIHTQMYTYMATTINTIKQHNNKFSVSKQPQIQGQVRD